MRERPLVAFTVLTQAAVGAFVILSGVYWLESLRSEQAAGAWLYGTLVVVGLLYGAGMLASFFHLGSPERAWRALSNLRSSWLSREILFSGLFGLLAACFAVLQCAGVGSWQGRGLVALAACLAGAGLVYAMGRVYMLDTAAALNSRLTLAAFAVTALLLGGLAFGVGAAAGCGLAGQGCSRLWASWRWMMGGVTLLSAVQLALARQAFARAQALPVIVARPAERAGERSYRLRVGLGLAGAGLAGGLLLAGVGDGPAAEWGLALVAGLVLAGEVAGRGWFYEARLGKHL